MRGIVGDLGPVGWSGAGARRVSCGEGGGILDLWLPLDFKRSAASAPH